MDSVYCGVISSLNCLINNTALSNVISFNVNQYRNLQLKLYLEGLYAITAMVEAMDGNTGLPQWGSGIADKIGIELHEEIAPYTSIFSQQNLSLDTNGNANTFTPCADIGNYYIAVKNRNHILTWSAFPVPFDSTIVSYDFSYDMLQAYGTDAQVQVALGKYAFYLGDLDQGGWVDADDFNLFEPDLTLGVAGFYSSDFNGGGLVDSDDFNLFEPRLTMGVSSQYPGAK